VVNGTLLVIILMQWSLYSLTFAYGIDSFTGSINNTSNINNIVNNYSNGKNNTHAVIIAFDDAWKSQFTSAKPILDRFGFKASYFIVCNYVGKNPERMTWNDVQTLERQGHDIESHSMNHIPLNDLSQQQLNYEIGQSKQCIINHSVSPNINNNNDISIFAYPYDIGHNNITVINTVAKYYQLGRTGDKPLAFLNCNLSLEDKKSRINETDYSNGECNRSSHIPTCGLINSTSKNDNNNNNSSNLTNAAVYYDTLLKTDRYSVRSWTHHVHNNTNNSYNSMQMFEQFIQEVNSQDRYNGGGTLNAIPIITYHTFTNTPNMSYSKNQYDTDVNLFFREMKYLYDNHFNVLPMSEIRYNRNSGDLYLNGLN
jgi:peptidoglycan/xylan/chitin deacetylase (PgdA/CDA1 family)